VFRKTSNTEGANEVRMRSAATPGVMQAIQGRQAVLEE
jgi:hypothetical protein